MGLLTGNHRGIMHDGMISASDVERYGYCPLSWWLSVRGIDATGEEIEDGLRAHRDLGESLKTLVHEERHSREVSTTLLAFLGGSVILSLVALMVWFTYLQNFGVMLLLLPLGWLLVAAFLLFRLLVATERIETLRDKYGVEGLVESLDDNENTPVLKSNTFNLCGRPDYVQNFEGQHIPVEVKTGRKPQAPFFSHILQLGAYCLLVEETMGEAPPYGQIKYGFDDDPHQVDWACSEKGQLLRMTVLEKLDQMNAILKGNREAHRNHNRKGKCDHCSRKSACPERIAPDQPHRGGDQGRDRPTPHS